MIRLTVVGAEGEHSVCGAMFGEGDYRIVRVNGGRGLRVYRGGRVLGFWEDECQNLQPGDIVVEIVPTESGEERGDGHNGKPAAA